MSDLATSSTAGKKSAVDGARAAVLKVWNDFRGFSAGQKAVTIAAALALVVGGYLLMNWKSSTPYSPLYTNLAPSDASAIIDKLNSAGVPYKLGAAGTEILVPQSKVYDTRLTVSAAGLPSSTSTGYNLLSKAGVTTSQFQQQIAYQVGLETELDKTIQAINGVNAATVHLAIPQQDVFNDGTQKPTASVLLATAPGTTLTSQQVQSVVNLVSSSVPSMSADDVSVTDSNGNVLAAPGSGLSGLTAANTQAQVTQEYNSQRAAELQAMIDRAVGPGHAVVNVNATLDFSKSSSTTQNYIVNKNAPPVSSHVTKETYSGASANGGVLGTSGSTTTAGGNGTYSKTDVTQDNALGTKTTTIQNAPGAVQKLAIAVLVDKSAKNVNLSAISQVVKSSTGFSAARGDTLSVQALAFDNSQQQQATAAAAAAAKAAAAKASQDHMMSLVKQGALAALVLALAIGTWLAARERRRSAEPEIPNDDLFGLDEPDDLPPVIAHKDNSQAAADLKFSAQQRRSLSEVAENRPEEVARVLSTWLNTKES